jgi:ribonuclease J
VPHGLVITHGQVAELAGDSIRVLEERVPQGKVFIDSEAEEVPDVVVRDRQHLAEDGFVIVVVAVDSDGRLIRDPEIITRGLVHVDASQDVLTRYFRKSMGRRPMILPVIWEM